MKQYPQLLPEALFVNWTFFLEPTEEFEKFLG